MTTFTNSEGKLLTYANEFLETVLSQLNQSNNYCTSGEHDIIFIKIGSNRISILDYTYFINRNMFPKYTLNENTINDYSLELMLNNTSNEYTLQGVYNANSYLGTITPLQQVPLAIYDIDSIPLSYTGNENIDITNNQIALSFPLKINNEIVLNPRAYDGAVFEMVSGTDNYAYSQNTTHGGQPIAQFYSSTKACTFHGSCQIPNMYNKTYVDMLTAGIYNDTYIETEIDTLIPNIALSSYYIKTEIDTLFPNTDLSNYYTKSEADGIDNELPTLILNTYTKTEADTLLHTNCPSLSFIVDNFFIRKLKLIQHYVIIQPQFNHLLISIAKLKQI